MPLIVQFKEFLAMRRLLIALGAIVILSLGFVAHGTAFGNPDKVPDLLARIEQLEKRVAQLEETIKKLQAGAAELPRTETETKLIGTWIVVETDKKSTTFPDMKFKGDGTCAVVYNPRPGAEDGVELQLDAKYQVIGTQLTIEYRAPLGGGGVGGSYRIISIANDELVLAWERDSKVSKMTYVRKK
jgi:hypothetical protein